MGANFAAELLKLGKRPATWMLGAVFIVGVLLFGYVMIYALAASLPATGEARGEAPAEAGEGAVRADASTEDASMREELLSGLLPENLLTGVLSSCSNLGAPLALILGALAVGSEYGYGTLKTVLSQRSGRTGVLLGKMLALGTLLVAFVLLASLAAGAGSYGVAVLEDSPADWPAFGEMFEGTGAAWLILMTWATLGAFLSVLFRGTALAIGLGLVYVMVLETIISGLPTENGTFEAVRGVLPGRSASSLAGAFSPPSSEAIGAPAPSEPGQAALILGIYIMGFVALAVLVLRGRDVA